MRNVPEFVVSFWGAALTGAIVVPLNSLWTGDELGYALADAGVSVAFMDADRSDRTRSVLPAGTQVIGVRGAGADVPIDDLTHGPPLDQGDVGLLDRDDPVALLYTSGTTGRPKGALNSNRAFIANLWNMAFSALREGLIAGRQPATPRQPATLSSAPLFHIGGISSIIGSPMSGSKLVLMARWNLEEALRLIQGEDITNLGGVPAVARQLLEHPGIDRLGLEPRTWAMGGAAVPPDLPPKVLDIFGPQVQLLNGYGLTETTSAVVTNVGIEFERRPDSVGRPNLTADIRVVDGEGAVLATGEVGEICARSPQVARGYWNDDDATKASFIDGWFHTGDVGYVDADGFVYVVDRKKDVVIRGGENVYCAEVEAVLHEHPAIASVAVVGIEERALGERVCAVVVLHPGTHLGLAALRAFAGTRLAGFKCPEALHLVEEIPTTATGKIAKNVVRASVRDDLGRVERLW
jgi:acyl-CoA synthetase (AMP-forming)/AMP-acid ligase II